LAVGQPIGRLDLDAGLDAGTQFACGHAEQAVGVDLEGHPDFLAVGQPIGRLDLDAGLDAGTQFACGHAEQAVGV
ncbi:hypothetical protein CP988_17910, partial [Enterococcus faecium]